MRRKRQVELLEGGGTIAQETRLFDPDKGVTRSLRSKEDAHDYRYFPDPDLLPLELDEAFLDECRASAARAARRQAQALRGAGHHALQRQRADRRGRDRALVRCACSRPARSRSRRANWVRRRAVRRAQPPRRDASTTARSRPAQAAELLGWSPTARSAAPSPSRCSRSCSRPARARPRSSRSAGLKQTSDTGAIDAAIDKILAANADKVAAVQGGQGSAVRLLRRPDDEGDGRARPTRRWSTSGCGRSWADVISRRSGAASHALSWLWPALGGCFRLPPLAAAAPPLPPAPPPKLLVVISVDQFSADLFDEYRPQFTGGLARLAQRDGVPQRLSEPCRDRDLPRPFDHPHRRPPGAHRDHRQHLDRPVAQRAPTRASIAPRTSACRARSSINYTVSPMHLLVPTLGELMKARWPGEPQRRGRRQGPRGGDDERPQRRPALVLGRQEVRDRPRGRAVPRSVARGQRGRRGAARRSRGRRSSRRRSARPRRASIADRRRRQAGRRRPLRARRGRRRRRSAPRPSSTATRWRSPPGWSRRCSSARARRPTCSRSACRRPIMSATPTAPRAQEMCLQLLVLDRELGDFLALLDSSGIDYAVALTADHGGQDIPERLRLAGRRRRGARRSGARRRRRSGKAIGAKLGLHGPGAARRLRRRHLYRPRAHAGAIGRGCSPQRVAAYRAHPQVEAVFTADADRARRRCRPARPTNGR